MSQIFLLLQNASAGVVITAAASGKTHAGALIKIYLFIFQTITWRDDIYFTEAFN